MFPYNCHSVISGDTLLDTMICIHVKCKHGIKYISYSLKAWDIWNFDKHNVVFF